MAKKTKTTAKKHEYGAEKVADLPWSEKKVKILKALKKLGEATSNEIAAKAGLNPKDARHYCYHAAAGGLVKFDSHEGEENRYYFQLTAKGQKTDFDAELKAQQAAKAAKKTKPAKVAKKPTKAKKAKTAKRVSKATEAPTAAAATEATPA